MDVSVIIPCYNSGKWLRDALNSVTSRPVSVSFEIIIVDDGSTDAATLQLLEILKQEGYHVLHQVNKGPAAARNTGVRASTGRYLLFLDSDNKIDPAYMERGVAVFDAKPEVGVVYGKPAFFGDTTEPRFTTGPYDPGKLLGENYIDMCAVVRRKTWEDVGGMDEERMLIGHEDWAFWVTIMLRHWKFNFVDEILYHYRILNDSLIVSAYDVSTFKNKIKYIYTKNIKFHILKDFLSKKISICYYVLLFRIDKKYFYKIMCSKLGLKKILQFFGHKIYF